VVVALEPTTVELLERVAPVVEQMEKAITQQEIMQLQILVVEAVELVAQQSEVLLEQVATAAQALSSSKSQIPTAHSFRLA
jgi:hypothetical protein